MRVFLGMLAAPSQPEIRLIDLWLVHCSYKCNTTNGLCNIKAAKNTACSIGKCSANGICQGASKKVSACQLPSNAPLHA